MDIINKDGQNLKLRSLQNLQEDILKLKKLEDSDPIKELLNIDKTLIKAATSRNYKEYNDLVIYCNNNVFPQKSLSFLTSKIKAARTKCEAMIISQLSSLNFENLSLVSQTLNLTEQEILNKAILQSKSKLNNECNHLIKESLMEVTSKLESLTSFIATNKYPFSAALVEINLPLSVTSLSWQEKIQLVGNIAKFDSTIENLTGISRCNSSTIHFLFKSTFDDLFYLLTETVKTILSSSFPSEILPTLQNEASLLCKLVNSVGNFSTIQINYFYRQVDGLLSILEADQSENQIFRENIQPLLKRLRTDLETI